MKQALRLFPIADLNAIVADGQLVAMNVGPDEVVYVVVAKKELDYRVEGKGGGSFAKTVPNSPQNYAVVGLSSGQVTLAVSIDNERFNIHDVQPLTHKELLLVCGRSHYRGPDDFEKNGRIYSCDGAFVREILLGDGIQCTQTTSDGAIWTSYFDEGIFGNYGWREPIGAPGLVEYDSHGKKIYEFSPTDGLESMCDCYALNVESSTEVWCYYYREFPLVRIRNRQIDGIWEIPIGGSDAFAVSDGLAIFRGGYKDHDNYHLLGLRENKRTIPIGEVRLNDEFGEELIAERVVGRGAALYLLSGNRVYKLSVTRVASALGS